MKTLALAVLLLLRGSTVVAMPSGAARCQAAKMKAGGMKVLDVAKCGARAILAGDPVDAACLARAELKFTKAMAKADAFGSCSGTAAEIGPAADNCVSGFTSQMGPVCCAGIGQYEECSYAPSAAACRAANLYLEPGPVGSVCNPSNGQCTNPPATAGSCCQRTPGFYFGDCMAGPILTAGCVSAGGTLSTGFCTEAGTCSQ